MSVRPFRFVHATSLHLDQPLWGVGTLGTPARRIAEDATLTALSHIVGVCLEHQVEFLLLTGNCFDGSQPGRARLVLDEACERLAAADVDVFMVPGQTDPATAWDRGSALPKNVTILGRHSDPVAVVCDSEVLATVEAYEDRERGCRVPSAALRIGLVGAGQHRSLQAALQAAAGSGDHHRAIREHPAAAQFAYLAMGNGVERYTVPLPHGFAHDPGCPQPLDGRRTADAGCTLIDVDRTGELHFTPVPTAVVRREDIDVTVSADASWDDLAHAMQAALLDREPLPTEKLWLVRWNVDCTGPLADALADPSSRQELCELVEQELAEDRGIIRQHDLEIRSRWPIGDEAAEAGSILEEFTGLLEAELADGVDRVRRRLPTSDWPEAAWVRHILDAGGRIDPQAVAKAARTLAQQHLVRLETQ